MKKTKPVCYLILFLFLFPITANSQYQLFVKNKSTEQTFNLKEIKRIEFSSGKFIVVVNDQEELKYSLSDTRYLSFQVSSPNSISQQELKNNATIVPNPATDIISVESEEIIQELLLYNLNGKIVKQIFPANAAATLNISELPSGSYILQIITLESSISKKIIKK